MFFLPKFGKPLRCVVAYELHPTNGKTLVRIGSDPFDTYVQTNQLVERLENMTATEPENVEAAPRRRGRPRKDAPVIPIQSAKRKPGRPKKAASATVAPEPTEAPKRGPGRPRKAVAASVPATPATKRGPGRPRKTEAAASAPAKRKPGRPAAATKPTKPTARTKPAATNAPTKPAVKRGRPAKTIKPKVTENPFRAGTNSHLFCAALMKGGTRRVMATNLAKKITITPWSKDICDADQIAEIDLRLNLTANKLVRDFGWKIERSGRGISGKMKVTP